MLAYFGNDILPAASDAGMAPPELEPHPGIGELEQRLLGQSHALNYLYWARPRSDLADLWSFMDRAWRNPAVVERHQADLQRFVDWARRNQAGLAVVVFPFLHDLEGSLAYVPWVENFFATRGATVVSVLDLVKDLPLADRIVNNNDVHPSKIVDARVAQALFDALQRAGWLTRPETPLR